MRLQVYAVFDKGTETYGQPIFCRARGEAVRSFGEAVNDPKSTIGKYPVDFSLWHIGEYDDAKGQLAAAHTPTVIVNAREMVLEVAVGK